MARYNQTDLTEKISAVVSAQPDPTGEAHLVFDKGRAIVAAEPEDFKKAFKTLKKLDGYRWIVINREDLFLANTLSIGTKAGIMDADGGVLKAADVPRK